MNPAFSIVIPLYNKENYILETLSSVFSQEYPHYEIIVVDDGSTDKSLELVRSLNNHDINIICHDKNKGLSAARNSGIKEAKNPYIAFLDADDYWHKEYLLQISNLINHFPKACYYATGFYECYPNGRKLYSKSKLSRTKSDKGFIIDNFFNSTIGLAPFNMSCFVIKKSTLDTVGFFNEKIRFSEDIDFFIRAHLHGKTAYNSKPFAYTNLDVPNQLNSVKSSDFQTPTLEEYSDYLNDNKSLSRYINFKRFMFAMRYKRNGNKSLFFVQQKSILTHDLNLKQRLLLKSPFWLYRSLLKVKRFFTLKGIRITNL
jgi:glycosyltransferase involved in cell wall biosynthesis